MFCCRCIVRDVLGTRNPVEWNVMWCTLYLKPRLVREFAVHLPAWSGPSEDCL